MFQFIFIIILMLSLGTILFLVARSLPRVEEIPSESILDKVASSDLPEKIDAAFYSFLEKFIRKMKVFLMKFDNSLTDHLKKFSKDEPKPKVDFGKLSEKNENEDKVN